MKCNECHAPFQQVFQAPLWKAAWWLDDGMHKAACHYRLGRWTWWFHRHLCDAVDRKLGAFDIDPMPVPEVSS